MTRIIAAALCCMLLTACGTVDWLSERHRDAEWGQSGGALEYLRDSKK